MSNNSLLPHLFIYHCSVLNLSECFSEIRVCGDLPVNGLRQGKWNGPGTGGGNMGALGNCGGGGGGNNGGTGAERQ